MKVSFGLGLGIGLSVLAAFPAPGNAQCFAGYRRGYAQAYYPSAQYVQPTQATYPVQTTPQVTQGQSVQGQPQPSQPNQSTSYYTPAANVTTGDVRLTVHRLLEDQYTNGRLFIVSALADLPDKDADFQRLTKNATDIATAVKPVLGEAAGDKLNTLLKDRVQIGADFIAAVKTNDATKKSDQVKKLQANADEIGTILTGTNPRAWPDQVVKGMLRENTDLMTSAIEARARQDWSAETAAFEKARDQARHMADSLANGLGLPTAAPVPAQTLEQSTRGRIIRRY
jgi:hypothetical protein